MKLRIIKVLDPLTLNMKYRLEKRVFHIFGYLEIWDWYGKSVGLFETKVMNYDTIEEAYEAKLKIEEHYNG